jgi:hypothetical protein
MDVESTLARSQPGRYSQLEQIHHSNCLLVSCGVVGFVAFAVCLAVGIACNWSMAGFWLFVFIVFGVGGLICWSVVGWQVYLIKREKDDAHRKANAEIRLLNKTSVLVDDAVKNRDNVDLTRNDEKGVTDIKVVRSAVVLEQARIQAAARSLGPGRNVSQQQAQSGPVVPKKLVRVPAAYDLIEALRRFPLAEDTLFLGVDGDKQVLRCNPKRELCHGAFNAVTGRGKPF